MSWTPSSDVTGYRIFYDSSGGDHGNVVISDSSTDEYTLTGLKNGDIYTIHIVGTSDGALPSGNVTTKIGLGEYNRVSRVEVF